MSQSIRDINKILNSESSDHNNCYKLTTKDVDFILSSFYPSKKIEIHSLDLKPFSLDKLGYLGVHERLTIKLSELNKVEDVFKILSFFVKGIASVSNAFDKLVFDDESKFYKEIMPQLMKNFTCEPWAPMCYLVKENLIILEDLKDKGFEVIDGQLNIEHIKSAVVSVAHFHASSFFLKERLQKPLSEIFTGYFKQKVFVKDGFGWNWLCAGMEVVEAIACKLGLNPKYASIAYKNVFNKIKPLEDRKNVLCHFDLWFKNLIFKEGSEISCRLIDFQMCFYTSYVIDLVQLIYLNTAREVRQKFEKNLIELYHKTLKETLQGHDFDERKIISLQEVTQDFEDKRICGLVMAAQYFPISLLSERFSEEFSKDSVKMNSYKYNSRKDFVMSVLKEDKYYRDRNEEAVRELMEYAEKMEH